jgi:outer membrane protein assembly factor BamB
VKAAAKRWSYTAKRLETGDWTDTQVLNVSGNFVSHLGLNVRGFTPTGKKKWQRDFPRDRTDKYFSPLDAADVRQAGGVLIVSYKHPTKDDWPHPNVIEALDPATGRTLWKTIASPYETVLDDTVYTPVCRGKQTERQDDCMLSARDARTGRVRWTIPTEHVPGILAGDGTTLVMSTLPKGQRGKHCLTALDKRTGARLGLRVESRKFAGGRPEGVLLVCHLRGGRQGGPGQQPRQ